MFLLRIHFGFAKKQSNNFLKDSWHLENVAFYYGSAEIRFKLKFFYATDPDICTTSRHIKNQCHDNIMINIKATIFRETFLES